MTKFFFSRYRNFLVLLALLLAQIIGLAVQVRRTEAGRSTLDPQDAPGVRLIRLWADALVTPPELLFHGSRQNAANLWQNYLDLRHVRQQNQDLQKAIDRMRLEQAELLQDAREGTRLEALMGFQQRYVYKTLAAQVIGSSGSDSSRVFYIDKGSAEGLTRDMAVQLRDDVRDADRRVAPSRQSNRRRPAPRQRHRQGVARLVAWLRGGRGVADPDRRTAPVRTLVARGAVVPGRWTWRATERRRNGIG